MVTFVVSRSNHEHNWFFEVPSIYRLGEFVQWARSAVNACTLPQFGVVLETLPTRIAYKITGRFGNSFPRSSRLGKCRVRCAPVALIPEITPASARIHPLWHANRIKGMESENRYRMRFPYSFRILWAGNKQKRGACRRVVPDGSEPQATPRELIVQ